MRIAFILTLLLAATTLPGFLIAQDQGATGENGAAAANGSEAKGPGVRVEKSYYVPFEKIEEIFEKTGRGIFLPYEEFLELWNKANVEPTTKTDGPPADAVIRSGTYTGSVVGDVTNLEVTYAVEALKKGWSDLHLPIRRVAVKSVEISNPDALFVAVKDGYQLFLPEPGKYEVRLELSAVVTKSPGRKSIRLGIPATGISRLQLDIPEQDARVDVQPSMAVTQTEAADQNTRVLAFLGNSTDVTISWMPPAGRVADAGVIVYAEQKIRAHLGERILKITTDIDYDPLRGEVDTLRVRMPADTRLLSVEGKAVREWLPKGDLLTVQLHSPIKEKYRLSLSFERILEQTPPTLSIPFPTVEGVLREYGMAVLSHDEGLRVRVARSQGLSQLDPEAIPQEMRTNPVRVGFQYLAHPLALDLAITKITPAVRSSAISVVTLGREEDQWSGWIDYSITKAGLFSLRFRVPGSWNVDSVGDPNSVEDFQVAEDNGQKTIAVSLKSRAFGPFRLPFRLVREGTAKPAELDIAAPEVLDSTQDRGLLGVSAPRALDIITLDRSNMLDAHVDELFGTGIMGQISTDGALPRCFRYRTQPASLRVKLADKKTEIDVLAQHLVDVSDSSIKHTHFLDYTVLYAPVTTLRFQAPSNLDEQLKIEAKNMTQSKIASRNGGLSTWELTFQPPVLGSVTATIMHESAIQNQDGGQPISPAIPLIHGVDVRGERGFVAIRKAEGGLEIAPKPEGMEAIDVSDLPDKLRQSLNFSAFRYFAAGPKLTLDLTRFEYDELATEMVPLISMRSVLSAERRLRTQAVLFVQASKKGSLELQLPENTDILFLSVNGVPSRPRSRPGETATLIDLEPSVGTTGTYPVLLDFELKLDEADMGTMGFARVQSPELLRGVPVGKVELELNLPPEYAYMSWSGNLHRRHRHRPGLWSRFSGLLGMNVADATRVQTVQSGAFPTPLPTHNDYITVRFETLAPQGQLRFFYMGWSLLWFLDLLALVAAVIGGTLFLRNGLPSRIQSGSILLLSSLILLWFSNYPASTFFGSIFLGCMFVCVAFMAVDLGRRYGKYRESRLVIAPDPFLEDAPVRTETTAGPSSSTSSSTNPEAPPIWVTKTKGDPAQVDSPESAGDKTPRRKTKKKSKKKSSRRKDSEEEK